MAKNFLQLSPYFRLLNILDVTFWIKNIFLIKAVQVGVITSKSLLSKNIGQDNFRILFC